MANAIISKTCFYCENRYVFVVPVKAYDAWKGGAFIQDAFPDMSMNDRELLISGACGPCFDSIMPDEDGDWDE